MSADPMEVERWLGNTKKGAEETVKEIENQIKEKLNMTEIWREDRVERDFFMLIPGDIISFQGKKFIVTEESMEMEEKDQDLDQSFSYHVYFTEYKEDMNESRDDS